MPNLRLPLNLPPRQLPDPIYTPHAKGYMIVNWILHSFVHFVKQSEARRDYFILALYVYFLRLS